MPVPLQTGDANPRSDPAELPDLGDPATFMEQFWHHGPAVHAYLSRRAGRQGADDLFGEVWTRAFAARASYDHRGPDPRPWLYGIARNTLRAHWRHRQPEHALGEVTADPFDEADGRLDAQSRLTELRRGLALLTEDEREVLLLVAWERLTPAEAAAVLEIPPGTARSRLHRARQVLQDEITSPFAPPTHAPSASTTSVKETTP